MMGCEKSARRSVRSKLIWGRHPLYAKGAWIKIARAEDRSEIARRRREGVELRCDAPERRQTP